MKFPRFSKCRLLPSSLPVRGAWIEIGRDSEALRRAGWSLPVRGAWIEIITAKRGRKREKRRSPCGERGLKYACYLQPAEHLGRSPCGERGLKSLLAAVISSALPCRSPCGERGLKSLQVNHAVTTSASLPVRGAWIEILVNRVRHDQVDGRSPCGERGLKYSRPPQRTGANPVAPRAGSVD